MPHRIHKNDITAMNGGAQILIKKSKYTLLFPIGLIVLFITAFIYLLMAQNYQVAKLAKLNLLASAQKNTRPLEKKPQLLPETIIPSPTAPITPTNEAQQSQTQQFEVDGFISNTNDAISAAMQYGNEEKQNQDKQNEERQVAVQKEWNKGLAAFRYTLESLDRILNEEGSKINNHVAKTSNYYQSVPQSVDIGIGDTNVAEIMLEPLTNVDFKISVISPDFWNERALRISCANGFFEERPDANGLFNTHLVVPGSDKTVSTNSYIGLYDTIDERLTIFVGYQIMAARAGK